MKFHHMKMIFGITTLLAVCGACSTVSTSNPKLDPASPRQAQVLSSDGSEIHYDVVGTGTTALVFVHGWSCDRSYWKPQYEAFQDDYTVFFVDLAGHGDSVANRKDWSMATFGADVAAVVEQEGIDDVILIGHSMGGPVILEAARLLGDRVNALVGIDTLKQPGTGMSHEQATATWSKVAANYSVETERFVRNGMFRPEANPQLVTRIANDMASAPQDIAIAAGVGMMQYDVVEGLKATQDTPLILINATLTPTKLETYETIQKQLSLYPMEDVGHFPMLDAPAEFNAVLRGALRQLQ